MNSLTPVSTARADWVLTGQIHDQEQVRAFRVHKSPFRVGRARGLELSLPCPTVSNEHAELLAMDDNLVVNDLGSTNGTFVNGIRIKGQWKVNSGDLVQFAGIVFRVGRETQTGIKQTVRNNASDNALSLVQFDKLMADRAVIPFFQPIVRLDTQTAIGYEVLGRSRMFGLQEPKAMFNAAALLNLESDLSRLFRMEGMTAALDFEGTPNIFLNTHPKELIEDEVLKSSLRELRESYPEQKITLEIHEAAITSPLQMQNIREELTDLDIQLAYDDYGAGQARLVELVEVPPDYLKFDIALIRGIQHASEKRQRMLESLVTMVAELGIIPLAEGIEEFEEHEVCSKIGFQLAQGYYYGRPAPIRQFIGTD
ncbi:MAG: EAL domain-containing protein (putative c-di-GMP-specific phosphodiesterase class I) [Pirellulaceae bacterium]|jgi:EAL domain-containing protein (putative c-di-GMP-specific phosphodiesterase class I)